MLLPPGLRRRGKRKQEQNERRVLSDPKTEERSRVLPDPAVKKEGDSVEGDTHAYTEGARRGGFIKEEDNFAPPWATTLKDEILSGVREALNPIQEEVKGLKEKLEDVEGTANEALKLANEVKATTEKMKEDIAFP